MRVSLIVEASRCLRGGKLALLLAPISLCASQLVSLPSHLFHTSRLGDTTRLYGLLIETPAASSTNKVLDSTWLRGVLDQNVRWATDLAHAQPDLLPTLSKGQSPKILWIGCADSRVPETTVLGLKPGDVFVHRNIANIVNPTDLSVLSVIEYAVVYLKVQHIILCGHTSCGGVAAALGNQRLGKIDTWLMPLRQLRLENQEKLHACSDDSAKGKLLVEANVRKGVQVLRHIPEVIEAIEEGRLDITGVVYDLEQGQLKPLDEEAGAESDNAVDDAFRLK